MSLHFRVGLAVVCLSSVSAQAAENPKRIGFEILQVKSRNEIIAWVSKDITAEQFDALQLPAGWFKNQPREVDPNHSEFLNSPGKNEGRYTRKEYFGYEWLHVATVTEPSARLDREGRLTVSKVNKNHHISFNAGRILTLLVSPEAEAFVRISRDLNRTQDVPTLPRDWSLIEHRIGKPLELALPEETLVIRADNQDSFQGPIEISVSDELAKSSETMTSGTAGGSSQRQSTDFEQHFQSPFKQGAHCLFIGHSFFVPVARSFASIAAEHPFPNHQVEAVFVGGTNGTPGALWSNPRRRQQIVDKLESGEVELLGMPVISPRDGTLEDYKNWIETALRYNPDTQFLIGNHWLPGGPRTDALRYAKSIDLSANKQYKIVTELRELYPQNPIFYIDYGKSAALMKSRFEAGDLIGIEEMVGRGSNALFRDRFMGHAGPMMLEISALTWLSLLYGAEIETVMPTTYDRATVTAITSKVIDYNQQYNPPEAVTGK